MNSILEIHGRKLQIPIIQGGMGVGVSLERLAGAVAKEGGIGCISTADCGYREEDFYKNPEKANLRALREEIKKAKELSDGNGLIGVNAMVATQQYDDAVRAAVDAGADVVISGAGIPMHLPELIPAGKALIAPIVSSGRCIRLICKNWWNRYKRTPDFVVIEGPEAGGHLGFKEEDVLNNRCQPLLKILSDVKQELKQVEESIQQKIPVFVAGGIWDNTDVEEALQAGADGVQVATRFIGTEECDASDAYKQILVNASSKDVRIIHSPVGMPGRAIYTPMFERLEKLGRIRPKHCSRCIKTCNPGEVMYCITHALIEAARGNVNDGLFFTGSNIDRLDQIVTVKEVMENLKLGWKASEHAEI